MPEFRRRREQKRSKIGPDVMPCYQETALSSPAANSTKKPAKALASARHVKSEACKVAATPLTGEALLADMKAYSKGVSASRKDARDFLTRLGVMTASGKVKTLIRD